MVKKLKNYYNFIKLANLLRGWRKYESSEYDDVIKKSFTIINGYGLNPGEESPKFSLPNEILDEEFIIKFFEAVDENGYEVVSRPNESNENLTVYKLKK
jgi:hypothetical protein